MNHELNTSTEQSAPAVLAQATEAAPSPFVIDETLFAQIAGGLSTSGPNGTW